MEWILVIIVVVVVLWIIVRAYSNKKRRERLLAKYGDPKIVEMIMRRMFWEGQTQEQLLDSLGRPADVDQNVMKSKVKETWKYNQRSRNRFGLRITVEDGIVVVEGSRVRSCNNTYGKR
jgi:hypothetical protein